MTDEEPAQVVEEAPKPVPQYVQDYRRNGFVLLPGKLDPQSINELTQSLLSAFGGYSGGVRNNVWQYSSPVRRLILADKWQQVAKDVYDSELVPFSSDSYLLPPQLPYRMDAMWLESHEPHGRTCGIWTVLHDMNPDNGPLVVFPGTHEHRLPTMQELGGGAGPEFLPVFYRYLQDTVKFRKPVYLYPRRGQSVLMHGHLIYGNAAARNPKAEIGLHHTLYAAPGAKFHWQPLLSDPAHNVWEPTNFPQLR